MPQVDLVMAAGPGFPQGSPEHRYALDVALTAGGVLDEEAWGTPAAPWTVQRFWPGEPARVGDVMLDAATGWSLRFDAGQGPDALDAPLHALIRNSGQLRPGEYVTIREPNGVEYGYRVVNVG